jgi:hypothetical protein
MPVSLVDASAVAGTRQAWVVAGRYGDPFGAGNYVLHFSGRNWTRVATLGQDIHLAGVAAVSARVAWVWGEEGHDTQWNTFRPYLALVSDGIVHPVRTGLVRGAAVTAMGGDGSGMWLAGSAHGRHGPHRQVVVARWDGTSWKQVPAPPGARAVGSLSASGGSDVWAAVTAGFAVDPWLVHWDGTAWSTAYRPPASLATDGRVPLDMVAASSRGRVWVAYSEAGTNSGSNAHNPPARIYSLYFDGGAWRPVPVPPIVEEGLAGVTMSGGDAWAIAALQNISGILHSRQGGGWRVQALPGGRRRACVPTSISAASPTYVIAVTGRSSGWCDHSYAYVYDGHRWLSANPQPAG